MLCYGTVGLAFIAFSLYDLSDVFLFFVGKRRDFYFENHTGRKWHEQALYDGCFFLVGMGTLIGLPAVGFLLILLWIPFSLMFLRFVRPAWVRDFEKGRADHELQYIKRKGVIYLEQFPLLFPKIIASSDGWDLWVTTII